MKLDESTFSIKAWVLGVGSAMMIVSDYYGDLVVTDDLTSRWVCCFALMAFFLYIVYELLVGLSAATASEADPTDCRHSRTRCIGNEGSSFDGCPFQRCLSLHGLTLDDALVAL